VVLLASLILLFAAQFLSTLGKNPKAKRGRQNKITNEVRDDS
jgi:hypothetical protein